MTPAELEALESLASKATPGPWNAANEELATPAKVLGSIAVWAKWSNRTNFSYLVAPADIELRNITAVVTVTPEAIAKWESAPWA